MGCEECGEPVDDPFTFHISCCRHEHVDPAMDVLDPARERTDAGTCFDCGAGVYIENDGDGFYWEVLS